ncbi:MAG: phosphotransferase [Acidimicrobiales bacterium]|nr:phosphotransferase [Acidimicrobiales bacterium]
MTGATSIPDRPDAITTDWLSDALAMSFPGVDVSRIEVLEEHSGTTGRIRLGVEYGSGPSGPDTMFVKLPPFDESQQKLVAATDMGRREARFYAGPAHEAPLRIPEPYFAAHGEERTEYIMVLEDLQAAGCTFTNRLEPHADDHAGTLIESLARLHAQFWNDPRFDDELSWVPLAMRGPYGAKLVDSAREQFRDEFPPVFDELCRLYSENHEAITEWWDDGEQTLIHGDTHAGNQFSDGTRVGLYDWAVISCSPGIRDVAIYLGNSCPTELRRSEQERWIAEYHRVLVESGVDAPSIDVLWDRYRRCVLYAWVAAATTASMGSKWQPIEVGMLGMTRATEACADLDTVGAFGDVL